MDSLIQIYVNHCKEMPIEHFSKLKDSLKKRYIELNIKDMISDLLPGSLCEYISGYEHLYTSDIKKIIIDYISDNYYRDYDEDARYIIKNLPLCIFKVINPNFEIEDLNDIIRRKILPRWIHHIGFIRNDDDYSYINQSYNLFRSNYGYPEKLSTFIAEWKDLEINDIVFKHFDESDRKIFYNNYSFVHRLKLSKNYKNNLSDEIIKEYHDNLFTEKGLLAVEYYFVIINPEVGMSNNHPILLDLEKYDNISVKVAPRIYQLLSKEKFDELNNYLNKSKKEFIIA